MPKKHSVTYNYTKTRAKKDDTVPKHYTPKSYNQSNLKREAVSAHVETFKSSKKMADKATAISSARRPAAAAKVAEKTRKVEGKAAAQKKLSATADKAHLKSNASLAALPNKMDAAAAAKKATAISSARGAKIAAAKAAGAKKKK